MEETKASLTFGSNFDDSLNEKQVAQKGPIMYLNQNMFPTTSGSSHINIPIKPIRTCIEKMLKRINIRYGITNRILTM